MKDAPPPKGVVWVDREGVRVQNIEDFEWYREHIEKPLKALMERSGQEVIPLRGWTFTPDGKWAISKKLPVHGSAGSYSINGPADSTKTCP